MLKLRIYMYMYMHVHLYLVRFAKGNDCSNLRLLGDDERLVGDLTSRFNCDAKGMRGPVEGKVFMDI